MAVTVELIGQDAVLLRLRAMGDAVRRSLLRAVTRAAIEVQARVRQKLAGEVLQERTHHLHDSIHYEVADSASGIVATVGTDVVYAAIHEYGFSGSEQVREHMRRVSVAFGKPIEPVDALVRAHSRQVNMPARSFLRSSLTELAPEIRSEIQAAVDQAVRQ
jgi:phage gpG-like protein